MAGPGSHIRKAMAVLGIVIAPTGIHIAMAAQRGMVWAGILVIAEAVLIAWVALSFVPIPVLRWTACAFVSVLTALTWRFSSDGIIAASAIPHAIAYLSVLTVFGVSLTPGRKAIITVFAEKSRGTLPPAVLRYTKRVTWAWCVFCTGQLLGSLALLLFAPAAIWSMFVNILNLPLLIAMFCAEFAWRRWRHGSWPRERLTDGFRMAGQIKTHDAA